MQSECQTADGEGACLTQSYSSWPGGMCRSSCITDSQCPAGTHCDNNEGGCIPDCTTSDDCREGYGCTDVWQSGRRACWPFGSGDKLTGDACESSAECRGGQYAICFRWLRFEDGYCSTRCSSSAQCGPGAYCDLSDYTCVKRCATSADCREGYECRDGEGDGQTECLEAPLGEAQLGEMCTSTNSCAGEDAFCFHIQGAPSGSCSVVCNGDTQCTNGTRCSGDLGGFKACVPSCTTDADCDAGYDCLDIENDGKTECFAQPI